MVSEPYMNERYSIVLPGAGRLAGRSFARMNGIGNAIVVLDLRGSDIVVTDPEARAIAAVPDLRFDQLMVIHDPREPCTDAFIAIHNTDGSPSGACGNGTRCVASFLLAGTERDSIVLTTATAQLSCRRVGRERLAVDMGQPVFDPYHIPVLAADPRHVELDLPEGSPFRHPFVVGMGNPHAVFFVPDTEAVDLSVVGPPIETAAVFPERANVSFAQVIDRATIRLRVWERGAGLTLACGSGACAALVNAARRGLTATVRAGIYGA